MKNYLANNWLDKNGINLHEHKDRDWKCIYVRKGSEIKISQYCYLNDIPFFIPLVRSDNNEEIKPLWNGYLHACLKKEEINDIRFNSSVIKVLDIPNQQKELEYLNNIEKIKVISSLSTFSINDKVIVTQGSLQGLTGELIRIGIKQRVIVRIDRLDQNLIIKIPVAFLAKLEEDPQIKEIDNSIKLSLKTINQELINYLCKHPKSLYNISPESFEILVADILSDLGYEIKLTPKTRDGGRDILAIFKTPLGETLTIVECKRYAPDRKIGISQIERLLWTVSRNDKANSSLLATTSYFSQEAKKLEKEYNWILKLKDFNNICDWLDNYGVWKRNDSAGLWLPSYLSKD